MSAGGQATPKDRPQVYRCGRRTWSSTVTCPDLTLQGAQAGLLGGWVVLHLLKRGEDPHCIRVLDVRAPLREDLQKGRIGEVDFIQVDITNRKKVEEAFLKPWPDGGAAGQLELTVFHTAATIRFYERHPDLLYLSENVNLHGTKNILDASRLAGAKTLVYTSSGSVGVRRTNFWLSLWQKQPKYYTQVINDDISTPKRHEDFFSNYAVSKLSAEQCIRAADRSKSGDGVIRTGCIRPGNGIYGLGGDLLVGAYLIRKQNYTWLDNILQSFILDENCSLAHLLYEQRLIELQGDSSNPDIGGQAFCVADSGSPPTFGDIHRALCVLSDGKVTFHHVSPTTMLGLAHIVELYHLTRHFLRKSRYAFVTRVMPPIVGSLLFLQPSMFALTNVHLYFDDSRARAPPEKGGLGYNTDCSSLRGVCQVVVHHYRSGGRGTARAIAGHAGTEQSPLLGAEQAVGGVMDKLVDGPLDAKRALN